MMHFDQALLAHIPIPPKLLVALIVLGLALIIWAIVAIANSGKKKQPQVAPNAPMCTTCGSPGRWNYNAWVCDRCQRPIMPGMPGQQMGHPGMHPGQPPMGQPPMGQPGMHGMAPQQMPPQAAPGGPSCRAARAARRVARQDAGSPSRTAGVAIAAGR
jgi:hypothetical protein